MVRWLTTLLVLLQAHFVLTYLVPTGAGGGWIGWPWTAGDAGILGRLGESAGGSPVIGVWLAGLDGIAFILAALAVFGLWVPIAWWRPTALAGALLSLGLMAMFFGPTKMMPVVLDVALIGLVMAEWSPAHAS